MANQRDKLWQKVRDFIKHQAMLKEASGVVVAVSGGADSLTLLEVLARLRDRKKASPQTQDWKLHIAHLNHLLRGKASHEDAEFVAALAKKLKLNITIESADVAALAQATGKGIEEAAREARYRFLLKVAEAQGCNRIATGHTMNDQAETLVMRLVRGAGLHGLAAMRPLLAAHLFADTGTAITKPEAYESQPLPEKHDDADITSTPFLPVSLSPCLPFASSSSRLHAPSPLLMRPLLCVTREEVESYCRERGLEFRTDESNNSLAYTRNRVRHETMQALREINPRVVERLAQTAEILACEEDALTEAAQVFLEQAQVKANRNRTKFSTPNAYFIAELMKHSTGLRRRLIFAALRREGEMLKTRQRQTSQLTAVHLEAIEKLLTQGRSGQRLTLPDGLEVWREFEALVFVHTDAGKLSTARSQEAKPREATTNRAALHCDSDDGSDAADEKPYEYWLGSDQTEIEVGGMRLSLSRGESLSRLPEILEMARREKKISGRDWLTVALDEASVPERLCVRPRQKGERVLVFGQQKIIKLKKLMIAHKIAPSRRISWPIVVTSDGEYIWSPGLPPALNFATADKSTSLVILCASDV
ncbi:MAG: tRNA lysidine(34) synthetase TilS [Acidobacteria bacterium]|nr:tRNA lysidine(34) synthetase TilS [Acidobacteriota bacterium]